jgi:amino acid transporter
MRKATNILLFLSLLSFAVAYFLSLYEEYETIAAFIIVITYILWGILGIILFKKHRERIKKFAQKFFIKEFLTKLLLLLLSIYLIILIIEKIFNL